MAKTALNVKGKDGKLGNADTLYGGLRVIGTIPGASTTMPKRFAKAAATATTRCKL